ncbi:MAG TPA: metalloregulator ArsR/SmtB family transcription factor [Trebonia sp.]
MRTPAQGAFDALSDPTRRAILDFLARSGEVTAGTIADAVDEVGRTAVSSHLRVLRTAGLVEERKQGRFRSTPRGAGQLGRVERRWQRRVPPD